MQDFGKGVFYFYKNYIMNKIEKQFEKYAKEGENLDVVEALQLLTKAYMKECGVSLGYRSMIYGAGEIWQGAKLDEKYYDRFTEEIVKGSFALLMPVICEEYDPDYYDKWDIGYGIPDEKFKELCFDAIKEQRYDEPTFKALCWGIKYMAEYTDKWMEEYIEKLNDVTDKLSKIK